MSFSGRSYGGLLDPACFADWLTLFALTSPAGSPRRSRSLIACRVTGRSSC
jgi:hypothetical protein